MTDNIIRLHYQPYWAVRLLVHDCGNYDHGNCLTLDNVACASRVSYGIVCK